METEKLLIQTIIEDTALYKELDAKCEKYKAENKALSEEVDRLQDIINNLTDVALNCARKELEVGKILTEWVQGTVEDGQALFKIKGVV